MRPSCAFCCGSYRKLVHRADDWQPPNTDDESRCWGRATLAAIPVNISWDTHPIPTNVGGGWAHARCQQHMPPLPLLTCAARCDPSLHPTKTQPKMAKNSRYVVTCRHHMHHRCGGQLSHFVPFSYGLSMQCRQQQEAVITYRLQM